MLPYLQLQAGLWVMSGILAGILFFMMGRAFQRLLILRYLVTLSGICALMVTLLIVSHLFIVGVPIGGFGVIAIIFYSGVFWLPLFGMVVSVWAKDQRTVRLTRAISGASLAVGIFAMFVEPNRLEQREERIELAGWDAASEPLRIAHISDLQTVGVCEREREAARLVNAFEPDFVVFTGDYIAGPFGDSEPAIAAARLFLSELKPRYGIIVVDGHSELRKDRLRVFEGLGLIYLVNESARISLEDGRSVSFHGLHPHDTEYASLESPREPNEVRVVVSHVPGVSPRLNGLDIDLHLAGHTHGGQIVIPGFGAPITFSTLDRKYARGLFRFGDHWLNVTAGIGMEGGQAPRIRLFCPPEVCLLTVAGGGNSRAK